MAAFTGFRPFLTKGSTLNGVRNTFFANSVNGVHYVPDAADVYGAASLAAFGEGVSTVLDEKNGTPVLGPELVVNGTFATDSDWIKLNGATISGGVATLFNAVSNPAITQTRNFTLGRTYSVSLTWTGTISAGLGAYGSGDMRFITNGTVGSFTGYVTISAGTGATMWVQAIVNSTATVDNISIKEVLGNHAIQASTSLRPLFGRAPVSRRNLLTYSQDFRDASTVGSARPWGYGVQGLGAIPTVTPNYAVAPDGTNTATRLQCSRTGTGGGDRSRLQVTVTYPLGATLSRSLWVKSTSGTNQVVSISDSSENNNANIVTVGSEWQRITSTYNALLSANGNFWIGLLGLEATVLTTDVLVWGAQFELGSTVTAYQRVDAATDMTESGVISFPFIRMDLSDDTLMTNITSTKNLFRYTEEFDNGYWIKQAGTITPNEIIAPDNTLTADKFTASSSGESFFYRASPLNIGDVATFSIFAKAGTSPYLQLSLNFSGGQDIWINMSNGSIVLDETSGKASSTSVGNGWYRITVVNMLHNSANKNILIGVSETGSNTNRWQGISKTAYLWGAQLEQGSIATPYEYGGFKGDVVVAGRTGTAIETVTSPDGVFSLGPTTYTGGTPGILRAVGDIVGYTLTGRTTTSIEQDLLIDFYKFRGAKGRLITGPELVINGTFNTNLDSWTLGGGYQAWINNSLELADVGNVDGTATQNITMKVGGIYLLSADVTIIDSGAFWLLRALDGVDASIGGQIISGNYKTIFKSSQISNRITALSAYTQKVQFDNISVKELRPEEEW